jgi:DNA-binding SARP family transcriptional activator
VAELRLRLLGGLEVEGLRAVDVGSRKARRLLAALAVPPCRAVRTDVLAELLWGDDQPARPGDQLGVLVSRLRGVIGSEHLVRTDAGYQLARHWVDAEELERRVDAAHEHLQAGDPLSARLAATMALDLVRGELLPEEEGDWFTGPRAAAARAAGRAGLVAAEAALALGDPLGAAAAASVTLDRDPYDEAALRALMRAHSAAGRPASALAAYAEVRARLRDDLGVSPDAATESLHDELVGVGEPAVQPPSVDRWDPLVQRARVELASNDLDSAWRDAQEAVRRGGGPGALELAGWAAYYARDFPSARRWAEEAAARTEEPERRASSLTLAARILHSTGDLRGAEAHLDEAVRCEVPGVRAMAEVWLGSVRAHQARPAEALALARRGAVDAAAIRHPFVISHSQFAQVYSLGQQGRLADALAQLDEWDRTLDDLGQGGDRYRPAALNFRAWLLAAAGRRADADACSERSIDLANTLQEPRVHAQLDLARTALDAGEVDAAARSLDRVVIPADEQGTMVWHQRHRLDLLVADVQLHRGAHRRAAAAAVAVAEDAGQRGAARASALARALVLEARARAGEPPSEQVVQALAGDLAPVAGLERWRIAARLASATGWSWLWDRAVAWAAELAEHSGDDAAGVRAMTHRELARLGLPQTS